MNRTEPTTMNRNLLLLSTMFLPVRRFMCYHFTVACYLGCLHINTRQSEHRARKVNRQTHWIRMGTVGLIASEVLQYTIQYGAISLLPPLYDTVCLNSSTHRCEAPPAPCTATPTFPTHARAPHSLKHKWAQYLVSRERPQFLLHFDISVKTAAFPHKKPSRQ